MRVMILMDKLYKESGNHCQFTFFNQDDFGGLSGHLVWSFTKHWRYTHAVNHRSIYMCYIYTYYDIFIINFLSLKDLAGPFLFLLAGMAVSFLIFLVEKITFMHREFSGASPNNH